MFDLHNDTEAIQSALAHYGKKQWDLLQSHVLQPWVTENFLKRPLAVMIVLMEEDLVSYSPHLSGSIQG